MPEPKWERMSPPAVLWETVGEYVRLVYGKPNPLDRGTEAALTTLVALEFLRVIERIGMRLAFDWPPHQLERFREQLAGLGELDSFAERVELVRAYMREMAGQSGRPS